MLPSKRSSPVHPPRRLRRNNRFGCQPFEISPPGDEPCGLIFSSAQALFQSQPRPRPWIRMKLRFVPAKPSVRRFCYTYQSVPSGKTHQAAPDDTHPQTKFGEWLSLVEHLVRDQGVGGSNPLSPTILSHSQLKSYAAFSVAWLSTVFGTFGTIEGKSKPTPHLSPHILRKARSCLILS